MRKAAYTVIALFTAASIAAMAAGATHHTATLGICAFMGIMAWATQDEDDDMVEFKQ